MVDRDLPHPMRHRLQEALPVVVQLVIETRREVVHQQRDDALQQILSAVHVSVQGHRLDAQLLRQ